MSSYRESILQFGPERALIGILTRPLHPRAELPTVIIPNTGLEHRVGPSRLHVELARGLAQLGITSFRMDLGGLGDSMIPSQRGKVDTVADLQAAVDALCAQDLEPHFAGIGLCSGAHDIHQVARIDSRFVACAFIDGYVYRTRRFWLRYYSERLTSTKRYANALRKLQQLIQTENSSAEQELERYDAPPAEDYYIRTPPLEVMRADLADFMRRDMSLCYLFTGQMQHEYNDRDQLLEAFPELLRYSKLNLHLLARADHTLTRRTERSALIEHLGQWLLASATQAPA